MIPRDARWSVRARTGPARRMRQAFIDKLAETLLGEEINTVTSGSVVLLKGLKRGARLEKSLETVARNLVERLLPYFISEDYSCPDILLGEADGRDKIVLNEFVKNELSGYIVEIPIENSSFALHANDSEEGFTVRIFKIFSPGNLKSRISLVAHKCEVSGSVLHKYIPEFEAQCYERDQHGNLERDRIYIIRA